MIVDVEGQEDNICNGDRLYYKPAGSVIVIRLENINNVLKVSSMDMEAYEKERLNFLLFEMDGVRR